VYNNDLIPDPYNDANEEKVQVNKTKITLII
jgi:hypothetical protein